MAYFSPYKYVKDESFDPIYTVVNKKFFMKSSIYPVAFSLLGIFFAVTQIIIPLVSIETEDEVSKATTSSVLGIVSGFRKFEFKELGIKSAEKSLAASSTNNSSLSDLEKLFGRSTVNVTENVTPDVQEDTANVLGTSKVGIDQKVGIDPNAPEFYYLSIPKLGISRAKVESKPANLDPDKALGHYVGSAFPGEKGNAFIYGHSVLPVFYNPKNYKSIFSTLSSLDVGDQFSIEYNNRNYTYAVEDKKNVKPELVDPLASFKPAYLNESTVTLMTCSPAGTKLKRLLIHASLVN